MTAKSSAQRCLEAWRIDYNEARPHGALGQLTPKEYAEQRQPIRTADAA